MTKREAAVITAYTGIFMGNIEDFHKYAEEKMCRPVYTHEFASKEFAEYLKEKSKNDFIQICMNVVD